MTHDESRQRPRLKAAEALRRWERRPHGSRTAPASGKSGVSRFRNRTEAGMDARVSDVMTSDVSTCVPETRLDDVARIMIGDDCGAVPVLNAAGKPEGIVTDRDIVCRMVAGGRNNGVAGDAMTGPALCVRADATLKECVALMRETQVRRVIVVHDDDRFAGILSVADLVKNIPAEELGALINDISEPTEDPFREDTRAQSVNERPATIALGAKRQRDRSL